jgi:hypothetical protein
MYHRTVSVLRCCCCCAEPTHPPTHSLPRHSKELTMESTTPAHVPHHTPGTMNDGLVDLDV